MKDLEDGVLPPVEIEVPTVITSYSIHYTKLYETCRPFTRKQIEEKYNRLSWWSRMFHWIKKLF